MDSRTLRHNRRVTEDNDNTARLRASDGWNVQPIERWEAEHFCRLWHYSRSAPNTATYCHGLVKDDWTHVGAALWIPPTKNAAKSVADDWRGVLCLSRLVIAPECPKNAASFLLGRSMRMIDRKRWPVLLTYADTNQGHTGAIYKATNWLSLGETAAGDTWVNERGEQRGRKRGGKTLRAHEMRELGFTRQPTAPKIKYVHKV